MSNIDTDKSLPQNEISIEELRSLINNCDEDLVKLINQRATYAQAIGKSKQKSGTSIYAPHREQQVYERISQLNKGPLSEKGFKAIYREIMSATIALEGAACISYLGPPGTFSHQAALQKFGSSMNYLPAREIKDVFLAVTRNHADYGIVPIENSTEGAVTQTNDIFMETPLHICSEIYLGIHHHLMAKCEFKDVKHIASHPQPVAQCRNWLSANAGALKIIETASTAAAAKMAKEENGVAAIASEASAGIYELNILEQAIEDCPDNMTRFVVLSHQYSMPSGHDRTSIMFSVKDEAGSLADTLLLFKNLDINLTRIESRPCGKRAWEYTFFIDLEGHVQDKNIASAMQELKTTTHNLVVLGSYPRAERPGTLSHCNFTNQLRKKI